MTIYKISIIDTNTHREIGYIRYYINSNEDLEAGVIYMHIDESWRGRGLAKKLMYLFFENIYIYCQNGEITKNIEIELDDMSDLARTARSIYVSFGFEYVNPNTNEPEMIMRTTVPQIETNLVKWQMEGILENNDPRLFYRTSLDDDN
jgi:hypothetical protein